MPQFVPACCIYLGVLLGLAFADFSPQWTYRPMTPAEEARVRTLVASLVDNIANPCSRPDAPPACARVSWRAQD